MRARGVDRRVPGTRGQDCQDENSRLGHDGGRIKDMHGEGNARWGKARQRKDGPAGTWQWQQSRGQSVRRDSPRKACIYAHALSHCSRARPQVTVCSRYFTGDGRQPRLGSRSMFAQHRHHPHVPRLSVLHRRRPPPVAARQPLSISSCLCLPVLEQRQALGTATLVAAPDVICEYRRPVFRRTRQERIGTYGLCVRLSSAVWQVSTRHRRLPRSPSCPAIPPDASAHAPLELGDTGSG
ncbi:hypothetical protein C8Q77DRAFT_725230 [Trametes polyzona]|nr:hypothetical protein C8Q77DRAFT_725230 [Trametes polyzona]